MIRLLRPLAIGLAFVALTVAWTPPSLAQGGFSEAQRQEIGRIVREYLLKNPEVLQEVVAELERRQAAAEADRHKQAITKNRDKIFGSKHQVVLGNPQGDVTLVEFFDYNCGYCKRALADKLELIKTDAKLRVVLKEFPVLGDGSVQAARIAVAVHLQDPGGKKYFDFHQKLLTGRGQADHARAMAAAKDSGVDMARLEKDLKNPEIDANLNEVRQIAEVLGINGTPTYVVGNNVVAGAVGLAALRQQIESARKGK